MTCPAAVNACRDKLIEPKTAEQVFREINWWVKMTINEAILELKTAGEISIVDFIKYEPVYQRRQ